MTLKQKESLNKFLTEWMGRCWHTIKFVDGNSTVCSCGANLESIDKEFRHLSNLNTDWTSRERFLDLLDKAKEDKFMFESFILKYVECGPTMTGMVNRFLNNHIAQPTFAEEWAIFLGWKEE